MNPFRTAAFRVLAFGLALPLAALLWTVGCDVDSTDSTTSTLADNSGNIYNYSGLYMNTEEGSTNGFGALVFPANRQSGARLIWLRLLQYGSVLEGYDNAGMTWSGNLSAQNGAVANFSLQGQTTAGQPVDVAGSLSYASQESTLDATWIEPGFAGNIFATATVSPATTNSPVVTNVTDSLSLKANPASLSISNITQLTASGCSSSYTWECDEKFGTLIASGSDGAYTRNGGTSTNSETVTVYCGSESKSVVIEFN